MSTSHTPGPWKITQDTTSGQFVTDTKVRDKTNGVIAVMHINSKPNAKLIAAAPDMLDALNIALMCMIGYTHRNEVIDNAIEKINEAINKATGQPIPI